MKRQSASRSGQLRVLAERYAKYFLVRINKKEMNRITKIILLIDIISLIASIFILNMNIYVSLIFIICSLIFLPIGAKIREFETEVGIRVKLYKKKLSDEPQFLIISIIIFVLAVISVIIRNENFSYTMLLGIGLAILLLRKKPKSNTHNS